MNYDIKDVHITNVMTGDTVIHNDKLVTVGKSDITRDSFIGTSLFGDSYNLGHKPVKKAFIVKAY